MFIGGSARVARAARSAVVRIGEAPGTMKTMQVAPMPETGWKPSTGS